MSPNTKIDRINREDIPSIKIISFNSAYFNNPVLPHGLTQAVGDGDDGPAPGRLAMRSDKPVMVGASCTLEILTGFSLRSR
jgi:hypothetical protein